ncbi:M1 family aminopeptidase [Chitinophaga niastensis]|nr:M1 family aminopeptidase [Chitinophaga niastensis]
MHRKFVSLLAGGILISALNGIAQSKQDSIYNAMEAFAPMVYPQGNATRTASGKPGAAYWQNRADYNVAVVLDTLTRNIQGKVTITYTNNSPGPLPYVWLSVGQNRFRKDSRTAILTPPKGSRFGVQEFTDGCRIHSLQTSIKDQPLKNTSYQVTDTYVKVQLPTPLAPGSKAVIAIEYDFTLPRNGSDFMGILPTPHGTVFQFGSMFPRMSVFDNVQGWNVFASGYYVEPGELNINFTAPADLIVQGTGQLMNPKEVLPADLLQRYEKAWKSDTVINIRSAKDINNTSLHPKGKDLTWHFHSANAGDGLWAASAAFLWDAVKVNLPDGRTALAMALYPPESNPDWKTTTISMKHILETYSNLWTPYPYNTSVNIAGSITGVAGPGVSLLHYSATSFGNTVWTKTNHELGHTWFNMMVAVDSKNGWMCEGLNTFINLINCDTLHGEPSFMMSDAIGWLSGKKTMPPVHTPAATVPPASMAMLMYIKPAVALCLLRNNVIGKERFDDAFKMFIKDWSFKHPTPNDFFSAMENGTGEDLSWFWRSWFLNDWKLDQAIKEVIYVDNDPSHGIDITIENKNKMVMPVTIEIREFNGQLHTLQLPAQVWQLGDTHTFHYPSTTPVTAVIIDPKKSIPDIDRTNNAWKGTGAKLPAVKSITARTIIDRYLTAIGGKERITQVKQGSLTYASFDSGEYLFTKKYKYPQQNNVTVTLNNINLTLKSIVTTDTSVAYTQLSTPTALTTQQKDQLRTATELFPELLFFDDNHHTVLADSLLHIDGMYAYVITVTTLIGEKWNYYYDAHTGYKIQEERKGNPEDSLLYSKLEFAGYRQQQGITLPYTMVISNFNEEDEVLSLNKIDFLAGK